MCYYYIVYTAITTGGSSPARTLYLYVLSPDILYSSFYVSLCLVNMLSIILCTMSNNILPYHTIPYHYNLWQLVSDNPYWYSMWCLRTFCVFSIYLHTSQCTLHYYALCLINITIPYHTFITVLLITIFHYIFLYVSLSQLPYHTMPCHHLTITVYTKSRERGELMLKVLESYFSIYF